MQKSRQEAAYLGLKAQVLVPQWLGLMGGCDCEAPLKGSSAVGGVPQSQLEVDVCQHKARLGHEALGTQLPDVLGHLHVAVVVVPLHQGRGNKHLQ